MTGATTVIDLLDRLPSKDRDCVRDRLGDSEYEALAATTLTGLFQSVATAERLLECFELENSRGLALVEAQDGGLTPGTRLCLVALSYEHPELFALRIGVPLEVLQVDHLEVNQMFVKIYGCMEPVEQLVLVTRIRVGMEMADSLKLGDVEFGFTEDEASCMSRAVDDWEAVLDTPLLEVLSGPQGLAIVSAGCLNAEDFSARFFGARFLATMADGGSQESFSCLMNFLDDRPHFRQAFSSLPLEEFTETRDLAVFEANLDVYSEVAQEAILLIDCLSDDELRRFQQRIPSALQAFQSQLDESE